MHGTAFKTKWLNALVAFLVSLPCFEFAAHEKAMHKDHHTWTNDPDRDPELTSFFAHSSRKVGFRKVADSRVDYWKELFLLHESLISHFMRLFNCAIGNPVDYTGRGWSLNHRKKDDVKKELQTKAQIQWLVYAAIFMVLHKHWGLENMLVCWIVPAILGFTPITYIRNGEHSDCEQSLDGLSNTRSTRSIWIVRFLMWNMNFHAEHHLYPAVPWFNLPKLHFYLKDHLRNQSKDFTEVNRRMYNEWIPLQQQDAPPEREAKKQK